MVEEGVQATTLEEGLNDIATTVNVDEREAQQLGSEVGESDFEVKTIKAYRRIKAAGKQGEKKGSGE